MGAHSYAFLTVKREVLIKPNRMKVLVFLMVIAVVTSFPSGQDELSKDSPIKRHADADPNAEPIGPILGAIVGASRGFHDGLYYHRYHRGPYYYSPRYYSYRRPYSYYHSHF